MQSAEVTEQTIETDNSDVVVPTETTPESYAKTGEANQKPITQNLIEEHNISAFSLSSIRAKRELQETNKSFVKEEIHLPSEAFNDTEMLLHWNKYAQRLSDKGHKIMESLLLISNPKLEGTLITHELPNEGSKIDFETEKNELLSYLRGKLHNHDIKIEVVVNEKLEKKFAFTAQDKYNRLQEINPNLDLLRKTFDLDI